MPLQFVASNHFKAQRQKGNIRLKAQLHNVSLTFADATDKITLPSSAVTAGFEVPDRFMTNSANANNQGPYLVKSISGVGNVDIEAMSTTGGTVTLTDGTENNLTIGTYLVKVLLMRSGFVFNKDTHATLTNLKADTTAAMTISVTAGTKTFTWTAGGVTNFDTAGFVVGNQITVSGLGAANGTYTIASVSGASLVVSEAIGGGLDVAGDGDERIIADDELSTGNGYTQDTKLTGVMTVTEDDTNDVGDADFPTVTWTASGGSIGPTPGAILYDDTTSDNTIIGYYEFAAEETATDGTTFNLAAGKLRTA